MIKLQQVDLNYSIVCDAVGGENLTAALRSMSVPTVQQYLQQAYGRVVQVVFVSGPFRGRSIVVFESGTGIIVGHDTPVHFLTHGYLGQGSRLYTGFLEKAGFSNPDATSVHVPSVLSADGQSMTGVEHEDGIHWTDGTTLHLEFMKAFDEQFTSTPSQDSSDSQDSRTEDSTPESLLAPACQQSGNGWVLGRHSSQRFSQFVLDIPSAAWGEPDLGYLMLTDRFRDLLTNPWTLGFFWLDDSPGPFLLIRADQIVDELPKDDMRIGFAFFRSRAGGTLGLHAVSHSATACEQIGRSCAVIETGYGLDVSDFVQKVDDAFSNPELRVYLAKEGTAHRTTFVSEGGDTEDTFFNPLCVYEARVSLPTEARVAVLMQWRQLVQFHAGLPAAGKSYQTALQEFFNLVPQFADPFAEVITASATTAGSGPPRLEALERQFRQILPDERARPRVLQYYRTKFAGESEEFVLEKILFDYERDRR